jgi:alpha-1,3/alpha-1,6-mannosyltransferase
VLHPCIDLARNRRLEWPKAAPPVRLVSINRFEGKKDLQLAVRALELLRRGGGAVELTFAGGYDPRLSENVVTYEALKAAVAAAGLEAQVTFECN